jgi:uncharacterized protein (DUF1330 family)
MVAYFIVNVAEGRGYEAYNRRPRHHRSTGAPLCGGTKRWRGLAATRLVVLEFPEREAAKRCMHPRVPENRAPPATMRHG